MLLCRSQACERLDVGNRDEVPYCAICSFYSLAFQDDWRAALDACINICFLDAVESWDLNRAANRSSDRVNWEMLDPNVERPLTADKHF